VATGCGKPEPRTLAIAAFMTDPNCTTGQRVPDGGGVANPHGLVRFVGATTEPCNVVVLSLDRRLYAQRMDSLKTDAPAIPVQAGEFRVQGNWSYDNGPGVLRVFAFCGGTDLRYEDLAIAVEGQAKAALTSGTVEGALRRLDRIEGLPPSVAQAAALFRLTP
jgi:hypothetical protein